MTRTPFERGRIISFIDAVFSIAMTLLVLEVAIPTYEAVAEKGTWGILAGLIPNFIGLLVSFLVTAVYWIAHLRIMSYVVDFDKKLLWLNIFLLLFVVLMPFSTSFYVNGFDLLGPFIFYSFNLAAIGLFNYLIVRYVVKKEIATQGIDPVTGQWESWRAFNSFAVWAIAAILGFFFPWVARFFFITIFIFQAFINAHFQKKMNKTVSS
ncbi:TMEM175 family protein [Roseivirga sp.]|uniref:TMEM175 family protein n=1 Tax=Roseivirga sp. TaxID=1964215 RepID=UPI002B26A302|nr:TMEM175 family protein [Roseivirga sp.]